MVKKYILIGFSILLFSCNSGKPEKCNMNTNMVDISMGTWILENQEMKSLLSDFIIQIKDELRKGSFIEIWYKVINDSTCMYHFFEVFDINTFIYDPPHLLFQFEQQLIGLHIEGLDIFRINEDFIVAFMKKNFPDQYDYYLKVGDYPIGITGGSLEWKLVFQNDSLIYKEEYYTQ